MTITTNGAVTGVIQADQAAWLASSVSGAGSVTPAITYAGDSIDYAGVRYGAQVPTGMVFSNGVNLYLASLTTNVAGTGTLEWSQSRQSLRYTAPGDTAGAWAPMTRSQRFRVYSAGGLWLEGSFFADVMLSAADASVSVTYTGSPYCASMTRGVPEWVQYLTFGRLLAANLCAPGASIRHLTDILKGASAKPGRVVVQIGTNDVIQGRTPAQIQDDFAGAAPTLAAMGAVVCSIPAYAWSTTAQRNAWLAVNRTVVPALCAQYGIQFVDIWSATVDSSSTTAPKTGRLQADNTHPAAPAACYAAVALLPIVAQSAVTPVARTPVDAYDATNNPNGNLAGNVGYTGTGGAVSGTNVSAGAGLIPNGYTASLFSGTVTGCVIQLVAASDGGNPWVEYAITGASAGATFRLEHNLGVGSTVPVAGQSMEAAIEWQYVAGSGGALRGVEARLQPVTTTAPIGYSMYAPDALSLPDLALVGVTPPPSTPWTVPAGATAVRHQVFITTGAGNCTVRLRNPSMRIVG